ncbi:MAG: hypothetical protein AB1758_26040, partial [Candidatus Eremiobacterota bacterium]
MHEISRRLADRLVNCLNAASYEMEALCRLAGVWASRDVPTAAVECTVHPRLLLNPDFVEARCQSDEHLFLLTMHELWHVLLAHTRLYSRITPAENIAFDAIINAGLCREFPGPEYRGFFEGLNPADSFPGLLLRPPVGWPEKPCYPQRWEGIMRRLYPPPGQNPPLPMYGEILLLEACGTWGEYFLLGDHSGNGAEENAVHDPLFGELIRRIVAAWPPPPIPRSGRDSGRQLDPFVRR